MLVLEGEVLERETTRPRPPNTATAEATPAPAPALPATLHLEVLNARTEDPLPGLRLQLDAGGPRDGEVIVFREYGVGTPLVSTLTDDFGRARFSVPSGRAVRFEIWRDFDGARWPPVELEPLEPQEVRTDVVRLPMRSETVFVGELVSASTGAPVTEAVVRWGDATTYSDREGVFQVRTDPAAGAHLTITAEGYTPLLMPIPPDHPSVERRLRIPMTSAASLWVNVRGANAAGEGGVRVSLRAEGRDLWIGEPEDVPGETRDFVRSEALGIQGQGFLDDLPAGVPLSVWLEGEPFAIQEEAKTVTLAPGESGELQLALRPPGEVVGSLLDQDGEPIANKEVWLVRRPGGEDGRYIGCGDLRVDDPRVVRPVGEEPARTAVTDAGGRFVFEGVYEDTYLLVPCPECPSTRWARATHNVQDVLPLGEIVEVVAGERVEVELVRDRGLRIQGRVVDTEGRPVHGLWTRAESKRSGRSLGAVAVKGEFTLGPLEAGEHRLDAGDSRWELDEPGVTARAGDVEVELVVSERNGCRVRGLLADLSKEELKGAIVRAFPVGRSEEMERLVGACPDPLTGAFELEHLEPGTYRLQAESHGAFGVQLVTLPFEGAQAEGLVVRMHRDASLTLDTGRFVSDLPAEPREWRYRIRFWKGEPYEGAFHGPVSPPIRVVPGGHEREATVELHDPESGRLETSRVELSPGQEERVLFHRMR